MKFDEYETLDDKKENFEMISGTARVHYETDKFFSCLDELYDLNHTDINKPRYAFRGQPEAKYRLHNSAQRYFYGKGIDQLLKDVYEGGDDNKKLRFFKDWTTSVMVEGLKWQGAVVPKILNQQNIDYKDPFLPICSYLRHYGVPTPVLDFSLNPFVALYFAIEEANHAPSNIEIENYMSLYVVDIEYSNQCAEQFQTTEFYETNLSLTKCYNPFYVFTGSNSNIHTNLNIINQEGCLIGNILLNDSLEAAYEVFGQKYLSDFQSKKIMQCFNIHKGLIPFIRQRLKEKGITKEFIYPDPYLIKEVVDKATIESVKRNIKYRDS
jgi:hypothetical protein